MYVMSVMKCNEMKCNVCMYVCNACMHACMYVCNACMHVCMYACMHVCMYTTTMHVCMLGRGEMAVPYGQKATRRKAHEAPMAGNGSVHEARAVENLSLILCSFCSFVFLLFFSATPP